MTPAPYTCAACGQPIVGEDPHTRHDGEDVHPGCCAVCQDLLSDEYGEPE